MHHAGRIINKKMKFSGSICGKEFSGIAAQSPQELYRILADSEPVAPMEELRCWALVDTATAGSVWMEILLSLPRFFENNTEFFNEEVTMVFKKKPCHSPESSPHTSPDKDESQLLAMQECLSGVGLVEVTTSSSSEPSSGALSPRGYDTSNIINEVDPFTLEEIEDIEDPLLLHFHKRLSVEVETVCVGLSGLEQFVQAEASKGKSLINLELKQIKCKNGQLRNVVATKQVWVRSILKISTKLHPSFTNFFSCAILREDQLEEMQQEKDFWKRIKFWISDFLSFEESQHRLTLPPVDGESHWMSPFYFSAEEADYVGSLMLPNTITLKETLKNMMEGKANAGAVEVCASHDLAPVFIGAFGTPHSFYKDAAFKKEKKNWIKKREKEMNKMSK